MKLFELVMTRREFLTRESELTGNSIFILIRGNLHKTQFIERIKVLIYDIE